MDKNKKYLILSILSVITLIMVGVFLTYLYPPDTAKSAGGAFTLTTDCSSATSSKGAVINTADLIYMTPGTATTTVTCYTGNTDRIAFNIFMQASSTLTDLRWRVEFSHSTTTAGADVLWFPEDVVLSASTATTTNLTQAGKEYRWLFASSTPHRIGTSTTMNTTFDQNTTGSKTFSINDITARFTRIVFYIPTGSAVGGCGSACGTTALGSVPTATSTNAGILVHTISHDPL